MLGQHRTTTESLCHVLGPSRGRAQMCSLANTAAWQDQLNKQEWRRESRGSQNPGMPDWVAEASPTRREGDRSRI